MVKKIKHKKVKEFKEKEETQIIEPNSSNEPVNNIVPQKKSKKSKKKTSQNRALEALNKLVEDYKKDKKKYDQFVERIDKWFTENMKKIINIFEELDKDQTGELTYEQFKAGMLDYHIPCNLVELHLLTTLLDTDKNLGIDFNEFDKGIRYFSQLDKLRYGIVEGESSPYRYVERAIKLLEPNEYKWINCTLILLTFENENDHPGHFQKLLTMDTYVCHIIYIIREEKRYLTDNMKIYKDSSKSADSVLNENNSLDKSGFQGGSYYNPRQLDLYYDFEPVIWYKHPAIFQYV